MSIVLNTSDSVPGKEPTSRDCNCHPGGIYSDDNYHLGEIYLVARNLQKFYLDETVTLHFRQ